MRLGRRTAPVRTMFLAVVALAALAAFAAPAMAADVTVVERSGNKKTIDLDSLSGSFQEVAYTLVDASGSKSTATVKGLTLQALFEAMNVDSVYSGVSIPRPGGGQVNLTQEQIVTNSAQPMVFASGGTIGFVRPQYGPSDANAADYFTGAGSLSLTQLGGQSFSLEASVTASKRTIKAGQSVTFEATAKGAGAGQAFNYSWDFNDGRRDKGERVKHTFAKRGTYRVLLTATAEGGQRKANAVVEIQVGKPTTSKKSRSGGGTNNSAAAPATGAADGNSGSGETASTGARPPSRKTADKTADAADKGLPEVTGALLSADTTPLTPSSLAARSGTVTPAKKGVSIDGTTVAALSAILLLGFGFASEFGQPGKFRRRIRGIE